MLYVSFRQVNIENLDSQQLSIVVNLH